MSPQFKQMPCQACGKPVPVKLDTRRKLPIPVTTAPLCKHPGKEFEFRFEKMSNFEIQKACQVEDQFEDSLNRLVCSKERNKRLLKAKKQNRLNRSPVVVSEETERANKAKIGTDVETIDGLKTIKAENSESEVAEIGLDRAKTLVTPEQDRPTQPRYLKSVSFPVIYNPANPVAPFGYDDNGQPNRPVVSDADRAAELLKRSDLLPGKCRHKNHPNNCLLCGTKVYKRVEPVEETVLTQDDLLHNVRQLFGLEKTIYPEYPADPSKQNGRFNSYREILDVSRDQILAWLTPTIKTKTKSQIVSKPLLKDSARLQIQKSIAGCERMILDEQAVIYSMSARIQKLRRTVEQRLDAKTREMYKRQSKAKIKKHEQKLVLLRERLANWKADPENWTEIKQIIQVEKDVRTSLIYCDKDEIEEYKKILSLQQPLTAKWKQWENRIVLRALEVGLCKRPPDDLLRIYPELSKHLSPDPGPEREQQDDLTENQLITKTGGAATLMALSVLIAKMYLALTPLIRI